MQTIITARLFRFASHYSHEHTVDISTNFEDYNDYAEDDLRYEVYNTMRDELNDETPDLEETLIDICRGYMRALYSDLRTEYEYLTSDEAVWETIVANDLHNEEVTY